MSDILEIEAYGQCIIDQARKMKGKAKKNKSRGLDEIQIAHLLAQRQKTILKRAGKMKQKSRGNSCNCRQEA